MKGTNRLVSIAIVALVAAAFGPANFARGGDRLLKSELKDGSDVRAAFRGVVSHINPSVVEVLVNGRRVSLGAIVRPDGYVVTKASELGEQVRCRLRDGRELDAAVVGIHDRYDIALLKVDATHLPAVEWTEGRGPQVGQWLATPGTEETPVAVGIVSVPRRAIPPEKGVMGVQLSAATGGPMVTYVVPSSAAARAGLRSGDVIIRAGGQGITDPASFDLALRKFAPGDTVNMVVVRNHRELTLHTTLGRALTHAMTRAYLMNRMSGRMSQRRAGFPQAIQHDTVLDPDSCGGPVVDLSGRAVGINIARAGRVETYAIPADVVKSLVRELQSGHSASEEETESARKPPEQATGAAPFVPPAPSSVTLPERLRE